MEKKIENVIVECINDSIINQVEMDAIVTEAKSDLTPLDGMSAAIHKVAGPPLYKECKPFAPIKTGDAVITRGYNINRYVIHTRSPVYSKKKNQAEKLALCYKNCLKRAEEKQLSSIAFGAISVSSGYPTKEAAKIAIKSIEEEASNLKSISNIYFFIPYEDIMLVFQEALFHFNLRPLTEEEEYQEKVNTVTIAKDILDLSEKTKRKLYDFAEYLYERANLNRQLIKQEADIARIERALASKRSTVFLECNYEQSLQKQEKEFEEYGAFLEYLSESGVGLLSYRPRYRWQVKKNNRIELMDVEKAGRRLFFHTFGKITVELDDWTMECINNYFTHSKYLHEPRIGFAVDVVESDCLKIFIDKFKQHIFGPETQSAQTESKKHLKYNDQESEIEVYQGNTKIGSIVLTGYKYVILKALIQNNEPMTKKEILKKDIPSFPTYINRINKDLSKYDIQIVCSALKYRIKS